MYVLYDEGRHPIYVGQAGQGNARLFTRLRDHTRDRFVQRWHYFSWFGLLSVNESSGNLTGWDDKSKRVSGTIGSMLNEIEGVLIAATEPPFNKQGAKFRGIARYRQVPYSKPENLSQKQLRQMLTKIDKKLDRISRKR